MSLSNIRDRFHRKRHRTKDDTYRLVQDDQLFDVDDIDALNNKPDRSPDGDNDSMNGKFANDVEKQTYEQQLIQLQEQLVAAMIENNMLAQELKQCKENEENERLKNELEREKKRNRLLQDQMNNSDRSPRRRETSKKVVVPTVPTGSNVEHCDKMFEPESLNVEPPRTRVDRLWERIVEFLYDVMEDFNDITQPEHLMEEQKEPLSVKTLKENLRRFKVAIKPVTDTVKGINNLLTWKSRSYTLIFFMLYMYSVWKGWFLPLMFFMMIVRLFVNFLHFKGFKFCFNYLDAGEPEQESDDTLGLSDKFNLVLMVATKVQNGLGSTSDQLEKLKNLLTWKHEGTRRVFTMLCLAFLATLFVPTSFLWRFMGLGFGIKIFIVNGIYNKYPKIKKRYDSTYRMWQTLPTDAQYERQCVRTEMDRYIVIPRATSALERSIERHVSLSSSDDDDDNDETAEFRSIFSLPVTECPIRGWLNGKRTVLLGKDKSLFTLLSKKRGKLYLTKSFLCFARENYPSPRNIVIPLQDIVSIDKVKINQRMPGKGMTIQILIQSDGKQNVLLFSGVIGRDDIIRDVQQVMMWMHQKS
ncbi:GRAM domain-containing protein 4 [Mactra antiquata]